MKKYKILKSFLRHKQGDEVRDILDKPLNIDTAFDRINNLSDKLAFILEHLGFISEIHQSIWIKTFFMFPSNGKDYWYVSSKGEIEHKPWQGSHNDARRQNLKNCFASKEEAQEALNKIRKVLK